MCPNPSRFALYSEKQTNHRLEGRLWYWYWLPDYFQYIKLFFSSRQIDYVTETICYLVIRKSRYSGVPNKRGGINKRGGVWPDFQKHTQEGVKHCLKYFFWHRENKNAICYNGKLYYTYLRSNDNGLCVSQIVLPTSPPPGQPPEHHFFSVLPGPRDIICVNCQCLPSRRDITYSSLPKGPFFVS